MQAVYHPTNIHRIFTVMSVTKEDKVLLHLIAESLNKKLPEIISMLLYHYVRSEHFQNIPPEQRRVIYDKFLEATGQKEIAPLPAKDPQTVTQATGAHKKFTNQMAAGKRNAGKGK